MPLSRLTGADGSSLNSEVQENCVEHATIEGFKAAGVALALSSAAIFGALKFSPGFAKSVSVSAKTALIASPAFGAFFLYGELALNECAQKNRHLTRTAAAEAKRKAALKLAAAR
ncbi:hypothetical protein Ndes2526B_g04847 [Nannochloris sp. 'desiccata']